METGTFPEPAVRAYANEHFVPVLVDVSAEAEIAAEFEVGGIPATHVAASDDESLMGQAGYLDAEDFLAWMEKAHGFVEGLKK